MIRDYPALSLARHRIVVEPGPPGDCHLRRQSNDHDDVWLEVIRADPHVLIADEVLTDLDLYSRNGVAQREVWLAPPPHRAPCEGDACPHVPCWTEWLLHIDGRNRTVIYRIGRWVPELNCWEAAWPD